MEVSDQLHVPATLTRGKERPVSLDRGLGGHQNRSGRDGEEKKIPALPVIELRSSSS
jgi:hypothetical protein